MLHVSVCEMPLVSASILTIARVFGNNPSADCSLLEPAKLQFLWAIAQI
jgi:hypothetical protein